MVIPTGPNLHVARGKPETSQLGMSMRRMTRLANDSSKKWENLKLPYAIHFYSIYTLQFLPDSSKASHDPGIGGGADGSRVDADGLKTIPA
jgi:hypothetical protein